VFFSACSTTEPEAPEKGGVVIPQFTDISAESGMQEANFVENPENPIPMNNHARLRVADINGDHYSDLIMHNLWPNLRKGVPLETLVFLARGDNTFVNFSEESGLKDIQAAFMIFADFDNDGDQDAFAGLDYPVPDHPNNMILLNDGTGRFTPLPDSGVELEENLRTAAAVAADFDSDGILDLFVGNGSTLMAAEDFIYKGNGDGTFTVVPDALQELRLQPTNGAVAFDYDMDSDLDIFVSTYGVSRSQGHNQLWENKGDMTFENDAYRTGVSALDTGNYYLEELGFMEGTQPRIEPNRGIGSNGFGVDAADFNRDGFWDIFLAAISHPSPYDSRRKWSDPSQLLINLGPEEDYRFENQYQERELPFNEGDLDAAVIDVNNDGWMDIAVSRESKYGSKYKEERHQGWFGLFLEQPDGTFVSAGMESGLNPGDPWNRLKLAGNQSWIDIEHDGDLDLLVGGGGGGRGRPNFLFENVTETRNSWVCVSVSGDGETVNRDGIGTVIIIQTPSGPVMRQVVSTRGTYSSSDMRILHFGLGQASEGMDMEVRWPNGKVQLIRLTPDHLNRYNRLEFGGGLEPLSE
jgi:hypothetical protein